MNQGFGLLPLCIDENSNNTLADKKSEDTKTKKSKTLNKINN